MLNTNENVNLSGIITVTVDGIEKPVLNVSSMMGKSNYGFNMNFNVIDQDLLNANAATVQEQLDSFFDQVKAKMTTDLGFPIAIR